MSYSEFLSAKRRVVSPIGAAVSLADINDTLYDWQRVITKWAVRKGRAALFCDCGLGKSFMQLEWARLTGEPTLILAPLCVAEQTVGEAAKLGIGLHYAQTPADIRGPLTITNYERLEKFDPAQFGAVVLDESSILKSMDGKTRTKLIEMFGRTRYRLCCTATPSPNDIAELANHAEFLGLMTRSEFLATWFVHDDAGWRMKRHARAAFFRWLSSWAVALRSPGDLGYDDTGYVLPPLRIIDHVIHASKPPEGMLFHDMAAKGIQGRLAARCASLEDRVAATAELAKAPGQWIVWCGLNTESAALAKAIPGFVEVSGANTYDEKRAAVEAFVAGRIRGIVTKLKVLGFGMNFQHCRQMAFVGMSDSYEGYYQGIRRCWRFGQQHPVDVHIVVSEAETGVVSNVRRKEADNDAMSRELLLGMQAFEREELCA